MIVEFEVSSPRVSRHESRALLEAVAQLSRASAITVIGHADESGPEALNDRLSAQRAAAVLERLEASGIPRRRLQLQARGEREPRTDGNSRRVEIFVGGPP
jgi:outer membrane protein OmpA-like peptidoglycan-associated protein